MKIFLIAITLTLFSSTCLAWNTGYQPYQTGNIFTVQQQNLLQQDQFKKYQFQQEQQQFQQNYQLQNINKTLEQIEFNQRNQLNTYGW